MNFNQNTWKEQAKKRLTQFKTYMKKDAAMPVYSTVAGMALYPLVQAALSGGFIPAISALFTLMGAVGNNLIASKLEKWKDSDQPIDETAIIQWVQETVHQNKDLRNEIDEILTQIDAISLVQKGLNQDDKQWFVSELKKQLDALGNVERYEQTIIHGDIARDIVKIGAMVTGQNPQIQINITEKAKIAESMSDNQESLVNDSQAVDKYLSLIHDEYYYLAFKGMGVSDRIPLRLPLMDMYVPLKVRIELPEGETWRRDLKLAGRQMTTEEAQNIGQREPQPVLELLNNHDCLIILGDPGAGKTTFLKYLSLKLSMGHGQDIGIGNRLPVLVPLSAYANAISENKGISLNDFIAQYLNEKEMDLPLSKMFNQAMETGTVLYLLDGLDEVQSQKDRRKVVDRMLAFYRFHKDKHNKIIMTSRIVGYRDVRPVSEGILESTLVDFETDDINDFVQKWTRAVEQSAHLNDHLAEQAAEKEEQELLYSVAHNKGVRQLAANPLLLTILALMKRQGVSLPERRVELYHNYIHTLLKNWNLVRSLDGSTGVDIDVLETIRVLAPLALWMHQSSPGVGLVPQEGIRLKLEEIYQKRGIEKPEKAAQNLLRDVHRHTALLLERGPGLYGFIHLTFQEYLAAIAVAQLGQKHSSSVVYSLRDYVHDNTWTELTRLCIAYIGIIEGREEAASDILLSLIHESKHSAINLAAKVVKDAWPGGLTKACKENVSELLIRNMREEFQATPVVRAESGNLLSQIGDPRKEVMTVDGMHFCFVPGGDFWMGDEKECHLVKHLKHHYFIGKYPITNAQFNEFVDSDGYAQKKYWKEAINNNKWEKGKYNGRQKPYQFGEPYHHLNHPVVGVTWYESMAFTRWLTEKWRSEKIIPNDWNVRLPSEAEWEKAARGGKKIPRNPVIVPAVSMKQYLEKRVKLESNKLLKRTYPWGENRDCNFLNTKETNIEATSSVGCFAKGKSPYGCEEMSGNVWDWTRSKSAGYPYNPGDGRENLEGVTNSTRISIRGGSYYWSQNDQRCFSRVRGNRSYDFVDNSFRVLSSPFFASDL